MRHALGHAAVLAFALSVALTAPAFGTWSDLVEDEAHLSDAFKANLELRHWKANPDPLVDLLQIRDRPEDEFVGEVTDIIRNDVRQFVPIGW